MSDIIIHEEQVLKAEETRVTLRDNLREQGIVCSDDETIDSLANKVADIQTAYYQLNNPPGNLYIDGTNVPAEYQMIYRYASYVFCPNAMYFKGAFRDTNVLHLYLENVENVVVSSFIGNSDLSYSSNLQELILPKNMNKNMTGSIVSYNMKYCILPNSAPVNLVYGASSSIKVIDVYNATSSLFRASVSNLEVLIIRDKTRVGTLGSASYIPNNTPIYVYEDILENYKTATNWSTHASNIHKIEGTIYEDIYWYRDTDWYADYLQEFKNIFGEDIFDEE